MPLRELMQLLGIDLAEDVPKIKVRVGQFLDLPPADLAQIALLAEGHERSLEV